ncbi:MAG TPA: hypothetical protein VGV63_03765 [Acidimicrobiales bacterium]|nr:hypothetical protein [Acidimicrobiales bacterium]
MPLLKRSANLPIGAPCDVGAVDGGRPEVPVVAANRARPARGVVHSSLPAAGFMPHRGGWADVGLSGAVLGLLTMGQTSVTAIGIFVFMTAVLMGLGLWMLAVEGSATGLLPIAFALFNLAVGIFFFKARNR